RDLPIRRPRPSRRHPGNARLSSDSVNRCSASWRARSTQAFRWPNSARAVASSSVDLFACGPLQIVLRAETRALRDKLAETFELSPVGGGSRRSVVTVTARIGGEPAEMGEGAVLRCGRMHVDADGEELVAVCRSGASCRSDAAGRSWTILVPRTARTGEAIPE